MAFPKSFCCKKSWSLLTGSKIIATTYMIFTAAVLSGLTFIMMNEGTFRSLSKMQPTDYLLIGKSLFPQAAYIESTSFESNNLPYSSGVTKKKSEKSNATNFILSKIQNRNNETNILEIKSNKNEAGSGASINGSNHSTVSTTSKKDTVDKIKTLAIIPSTATPKEIEIKSEATIATSNSVMKSSISSTFKTEEASSLTTQLSDKKTTGTVNSHSSVLLTDSPAGTLSTSKIDELQAAKETTIPMSSSAPNGTENHDANSRGIIPILKSNKIRGSSGKNSKIPSKTTKMNNNENEDLQFPSSTGSSSTSKKGEKKTAKVTATTTASPGNETHNVDSSGGLFPMMKSNKQRGNSNKSKDNKSSKASSKAGKGHGNSTETLTGDHQSSTAADKTRISAASKSRTMTKNAKKEKTSSSNKKGSHNKNDEENDDDVSNDGDEIVSKTSSKHNQVDIHKTTLLVQNLTNTFSSTANKINKTDVSKIDLITSSSIKNKSTFNGNQTTMIENQHQTPSAPIQNSSSVSKKYVSKKSIMKDDISKTSTITTNNVTITTLSTNFFVGNNSFVTSRPNVSNKSTSDGNQTTISTFSTAQKHSDDFKTSSYISTNKSTKKDESKTSTNASAKVTTIHSTNISIDNSSMIISSQNVTSTTLGLPINLLNQSLETHEATSQKEPIKLKVSAKGKKKTRIHKKKSPGSRTNETKTDDKDEPTTIEPIEPVTVQPTELPAIESSIESTQSTAEATVEIRYPRKKLWKPSVPDTNSENLGTPQQLDKITNSHDNANDQSTTSESFTENNKKRRNKLNQKSGSNDHENPNAPKESNLDTLTTAFVSTTVSHITESMQTDVISTITSKSKRIAKSSKKEKGKHSEKAEEKDLKEENEVTSRPEGHTTIGKETKKITTMKKGRKGKADVKLFGLDTHSENEHHTVDESITTVNNDHSSVTTDKPSITTDDTHTSAKSKPNSNTKKAKNSEKVEEKVTNHHEDNALKDEKVVAINKESRTTKHSETKVVHGKATVKKSATTKKGRKGKADINMFGGGQNPSENEDQQADDHLPKTNNDHSVAATDKPSITIIDDSNISTKSTKNTDTKKVKNSVQVGEKNSNHHKDNGPKDGKKATAKKEPRRKGKMIDLGISGGKDHYAEENPSRRKRSEHKNNSTKPNKTHNNHKENDTEILVNNVLISGITLHGVYFGVCILLMIGILKRSAGFVAPWLLVEFFRQLGVITIWGFLCYYTVDILNNDANDAKFAIPFCAVVLVVIALTFYFWLVVCSLYNEFHGKVHQILPEEKGDPIDSQPISNT